MFNRKPVDLPCPVCDEPWELGMLYKEAEYRLKRFYPEYVGRPHRHREYARIVAAVRAEFISVGCEAFHKGHNPEGQPNPHAGAVYGCHGTSDRELRKASRFLQELNEATDYE